MSSNKFVKSFSKKPQLALNTNESKELINSTTVKSNNSLQVPAIRMTHVDKSSDKSAVPFYQGVSNLRKPDKQSKSAFLSTSRVHFNDEKTTSVVENSELTKPIEFTENPNEKFTVESPPKLNILPDQLSANHFFEEHFSDKKLPENINLQTSYHFHHDPDEIPPSLSPNKPVKSIAGVNSVCSLINHDIFVSDENHIASTVSKNSEVQVERFSAFDSKLVTADGKYLLSNDLSYNNEYIPENILELRNSFPFIEGYSEFTDPDELAIRASKCNTTPIKLIDSSPVKLKFSKTTLNLNKPNTPSLNSTISASTEVFESPLFRYLYRYIPIYFCFHSLFLKF